MRERRKAQRWPAYLGGVIALDHQSTLDCLIRNTSPCGARLTIDRADLLPEEFTLHIPAKQTEVRVTTRWCRADVIGIEAIPMHQSDAPISLALVRRLRLLEQQNQRLRRRLADLTETLD
jgi:PilZ domain-containing protein